MTTVPHGGWRKSSRSSGSETCVELRFAGAVRDSKNPAGPALVLPVAGLLAAVKAGSLPRC